MGPDSSVYVEGAPLLHPIDRRGDLRVGRALAKVGLDLHPSNAPFGIEHEDGGMGNAVLLLPRVRFVAEGVAVDDSRQGIGQQRERHLPSVIGSEELRELPSLLR